VRPRAHLLMSKLDRGMSDKLFLPGVLMLTCATPRRPDSISMSSHVEHTMFSSGQVTHDE
jgi:hypothetical protein